MMLLTKALKAKLLKNGKVPDSGHKPVVKFFNPAGAATWLFSELDSDGDTLFGLCDLGAGCPELGYASLKEITAIKIGWGLGIERDRHWKASRSMADYCDLARRYGRIVA